MLTQRTIDARADAFIFLLQDHARIAIIGAPRTGKTTLASFPVGIGDGRDVVHTDDYFKVAWDDVPAALIDRCASLRRFIVEGVQVARALRAGLEVDAILYLDDPCVDQSKGQRSMGKAIATIFAEWRAAHRTIPVISPDIPQ